MGVVCVLGRNDGGELGERLGVDLMTVSRWERGSVSSRRESMEALEKLKKAAARKGVTIPE